MPLLSYLLLRNGRQTCRTPSCQRLFIRLVVMCPAIVVGSCCRSPPSANPGASDSKVRIGGLQFCVVVWPLEVLWFAVLSYSQLGDALEAKESPETESGDFDSKLEDDPVAAETARVVALLQVREAGALDHFVYVVRFP
jgi:hypothetical protein